MIFYDINLEPDIDVLSNTDFSGMDEEDIIIYILDDKSNIIDKIIVRNEYYVHHNTKLLFKSWDEVIKFAKQYKGVCWTDIYYLSNQININKKIVDKY